MMMIIRRKTTWKSGQNFGDFSIFFFFIPPPRLLMNAEPMNLHVITPQQHQEMCLISPHLGFNKKILKIHRSDTLMATASNLVRSFFIFFFFLAFFRRAGNYITAPSCNQCEERNRLRGWSRHNNTRLKKKRRKGMPLFFSSFVNDTECQSFFFFWIDKLKFYQKKNQKMMKLANQRAEPIIRKDERPPKFYLVCVIECKRKEI